MNRKQIGRLFILSAVLAFSVIVLPLSGAAAVPQPFIKPQTEPPPLSDLSDVEGLEAFIDSLVTSQIKVNKTPGLAVVILKGDQVLLAKGYGYIDEEDTVTVDPQQTLFRVGTLSTIPTAFAVIQLVEQGKLDLDADINTYLPGFKIRDAFSKPVTVRQLLNKTGGFDTLTWIGEPGTQAQDKMPLKEYLREAQPSRIYPPGIEINSSPDSYDYLLAGYLVEAVSGIPFEQYMEEHVFPMLSAADSTYRQPVPEPLAASFSQGYVIRGPYAEPSPFHYYSAVPTHAMSSSVSDMARFITVLLNNGKLGEQTILDESSVSLLLQNGFAYHPLLSGQRSTFTEFTYNGQRGLYMLDMMTDYSSGIYLFPDEKIGILLFANSVMGNLLLQLPTKFSDAYLAVPPQDEEEIEPSVDLTALPVDDLERYAGFYHRSGLPEKTFWKTSLIQGTWETAKVTPDENGGLNIRGGVGLYSWDTDWMNVDSHLFQFAGGKKEAWTLLRFNRDGYITFGEDEKGGIDRMYSAEVSYERMAWFEDAALNILLFVLSLGAFGTYLWQEVVLWLTNWLTIPPYEDRGKLEASRSRYLSRLSAGLASILGGGIILTLLALLLTDITWLQRYTPERQLSFLYTVMTFPMIFLILVPCVVVATVFVWKDRYWTLKNRIYFTAVTVASLVTLWQFNIWNVLGYRF